MWLCVVVSRLPEAPTEGVLSKQMFFKVDRCVYSQNITKIPVKKFTFNKIEGCRLAALLKINSFAGIFKGL